MIDQVEGLLEENDYDYCLYNGCFDIAASKMRHTENILLLKVLENVDSFLEGQADSLTVISHNISASGLVVGKKTRTEKLRDSIIYERFGVPTVNLHTLGLILEGNIPYIYRTRGGLFSEINPDKLKSARQNAGMSQHQLAEKAGITKKSIYEHESRHMKTELRTAKRLESILDEELTEPVALTIKKSPVIEAKGGFEKSVSKDLNTLGLLTKFVYKSPFNIIASADKMLIVSEAEEKTDKIKRNAKKMSEFISVVRKPGIVITKDEVSLDLPAVTEKQLKSMRLRDIKKLIK